MILRSQDAVCPKVRVSQVKTTLFWSRRSCQGASGRVQRRSGGSCRQCLLLGGGSPWAASCARGRRHTRIDPPWQSSQRSKNLAKVEEAMEERSDRSSPPNNLHKCTYLPQVTTLQFIAYCLLLITYRGPLQGPLA